MMPLDFLECMFWYVVFRGYQMAVAFVTWLLPTSCAKRIGRSEFAKYKIKITTDYDGDGTSLNNKTTSLIRDEEKLIKCEVVVHNAKLFQRFQVDDILGVGESYMEGWWDSDDLLEVIRIGLSMPASLTEVLGDRYLNAVNKQTTLQSLAVARVHYCLSPELWEAMLGPTMNYTCGYWKKDTHTLEEAQINKMDLVAKKLKLKPGMKVLDLGCGWGSAAHYMATHHNVSVVAYNNCPEQVGYCRRKCKGLDVTIHCDDYRNATGTFDAVYSIGLFEHIGHTNGKGYFQVVHRCLTQEGVALVQTTVSADNEIRTCRWSDKYIFPGGEFPYSHEMLSASKDFGFVLEDVHSFGRSYVKTLAEWHRNFNAHWDELEPKFASLVEGKFYRMWNFYLLAGLAHYDTRLAQLVQFTYTRLGRKEEYVSVR
ncbi:Cyclopropane-fatty-acyl-phospholipid synthase [Seminavis robusta]|uniref:Cyclopropane-fatty-acyl-phospholipid synthase n=1 Tax=Seminavis robusta TaxID=568900 RepID=A0A9N8HVZ1_9STRA|nr:Cyclopropane-fatty-acyl-phospholipid synthase [Seminavis robusta]|eukprot:Sro2034_g311980.1 Cyclopropane-fatty-acyl-phospholipid synthase (425) ;mRNA; r:7254-8603